MESDFDQHDADEARASLAAADEARARLTSRLRLPAGLYPVLTIAVTLQLGTAAYGIAAQTLAGVGIALAGVAVLFGAAALLLHRFHRINGVTVDGLTSQLALTPGGPAMLAYIGALAAGIWAAFAGQWWIVALVAIAGGIACALGTRHWWRTYLAHPSTHARGASPLALALIAVAAGLGFAALVVFGR